MKRSTTSRPLTKRQKLFRVLLVVLAILIGIRLVLPWIILRVVNEKLSTMEGYFGHVQDIDLSLYRGAYKVKDIYINKVNEETKKQTSLFECPLIDISVEWRSLFKGRIVSEMEFNSPSLAFTANEAEPEEMENDTQDFRKILKTFTPISVNRFEIFDGRLAYVDPGSSPKVEVALTQAYIQALNLSNVVDTTALPARISASANVYGGTLSLKMRINALADDPTYDLNLEIADTELVRMNEFFMAYGDFDVNKGTFGMYMELAAKDRKFLGYVKPFIKDLDVVGPEDKKDNILRKIWEGIIGVAGDILEAPKSDNIATKIPIAGEYDQRSIGVWYAVWGAVRNGLFRALYPSLDDQVNLSTVNQVKKEEVGKEKFFRKVFGKPGDDKKRKDKEPKKKK